MKWGYEMKSLILSIIWELNIKSYQKLRESEMEISSEDITSNSRDKILTTKISQVWEKIVRLMKD